MERVLAVLSVLAVFGAIMVLARIYVRRRFDVVFLALLLSGFWFVFRPIQLAIGLDSATPDYLFPNGHLQLLLIAEAGALVWLAGFGLGAAVGGAVGGPVAAILPRLEGEPSPIFVMVGLAAVTALAGAVTFGLFAASGGGLAESIRFVKAEKAVAGFYFLRQFVVVGVLLSIFALYYLSYLRRVRLLVIPNWWSLAIVLCFIVNAFGIYAWGQRYSVAMSAVGMIAGYHYFVARLSVIRFGCPGDGDVGSVSRLAGRA